MFKQDEQLTDPDGYNESRSGIAQALDGLEYKAFMENVVLSDCPVAGFTEDCRPDERQQITPDALKGGFKADKGKSKISLIPPRVILELGDLYAQGAAKYSPRNWELGMDFDRPYDACQRHLLKWWDGEERDPIDGQRHLVSVIWNAVALLHYMQNYEKYKQFDTRSVAPTRAEEGNQK